MILVSGALNSFSALTPNTKLYFWETRIEGVAEEFLRRSPRLRSTHNDYKVNCYNIETCDEQTYFKKRDQIVKEEWSDIFERLVISSDWGNAGWAEKNHKEFLYYLSEDTGFGYSNLRDQYLPVLHYRKGELRLDVDSLEKNRIHFVPRAQKYSP
jgi:hypothetical protein